MSWECAACGERPAIAMVMRSRTGEWVLCSACYRAGHSRTAEAVQRSTTSKPKTKPKKASSHE